MEALGARVQVLTGDVADAERMKWVLDEAGREAPLKGIVHAAGVMDPRALADMTPDQVRAVFRAKVSGGWVLHERSESLELDFFVTYSSAAGVWGSQGAGHYAAANHFLDALVSYRRGKGLPGLSVSWGPWGGGGMATDASQRWLAQMGVGALAPEQGLEALGRLLGTGVGQATVAAVDFRLFRPVFEARANRRLLERIALAAPVRPAGIPVLKKLVDEAPPHARWELVLSHVRDQAVAVLHLDPSRTPDPRKGLPAMGMDSLMAVELKNRLQDSVGQALPATVTFEYPSIEALAGYLAAEVFGFEPPLARETAEMELPGDAGSLLDRIEQLADEDVDRLLARRAGGDA